MTPRRSSLFFARGALAFLAAPLAAQNVTEVQVSPPNVTIKVGQRSGLLGTAFDRVGNVIPTIRLTWSSSNVSIATVDINGTVTGVSGGTVLITATAGSRKGQALVTVTGAAPVVTAPQSTPTQSQPAASSAEPPPPAGFDPFAGQPAGIGAATALQIVPAALFLLPSENTRVSPRALKADGSAAAPVRVTWKSLREDIATVDASGNVIAIAPGQGTIQVTGPGGLTNTAPVVVQQADFAFAETGPLMYSPGQLDTLHVAVPAQNNRDLSPLALTWLSSDTNVVRVNLNGVVTAVAGGRATITVSRLLQTRSIEVRVHRQVEVLAVLPHSNADVPVPLTASVKFEAQALAADNTAVPEAPLRWSVQDSSVATFDTASHRLTGRKIGKTQLVLRGPGSGLTVTWNVSVIAAAVKLSATRLGTHPEERTPIKATFADDAGNSLGPASNLTWSSDNSPVATVAEDGTITAQDYGRARVTATAPGGRTAAVEVYVVGEIALASNRSGKYQLYGLERTNFAQLRRLSADTGDATDPAFSPDGARLAFASRRDGNPEIYLMDVDGTNLLRITNEPHNDGRPAFTPDGQTLVFQSDRSGKLQIWSVGVDGTGLKMLTADSGAFEPSVSPDGSTIAYISTREKNYDVWLMNRDGSNQRAFTRSPTYKETEPHFLKDGTLAYLVERREGNRTITQVVKADLPTGQVTPITGTDLLITGFAVAPAGDLLALVVATKPDDRKNPGYKVFLQPVGSGAAAPLPTTGAEQMVTPAFLP